VPLLLILFIKLLLSHPQMYATKPIMRTMIYYAKPLHSNHML